MLFLFQPVVNNNTKKFTLTPSLVYDNQWEQFLSAMKIF